MNYKWVHCYNMYITGVLQRFYIYDGITESKLLQLFERYVISFMCVSPIDVICNSLYAVLPFQYRQCIL